jgi:hypothetical protein
MNTYSRRLAKTIVCPKTKKALSEIVDTEFEFLNQHLCYVLRKAVRQWCGDRNVSVVGPKHIGVDNYRMIFVENKLPCMKNVLRIADKLNLQLTFRNYPFLESLRPRVPDFNFGANFEHAEFVVFLSDLAVYRAPRSDSSDMKLERERILYNLIVPEFPVYWTTLIRYSAACGYQANFYLNKKEFTDSKVTPKIEGCLTPGKTEDRLEIKGEPSGGCGEGGCDAGDYAALLRRLDYPA